MKIGFSKGNLNQEVIMKTLDYTYDKVLTGLPGIESAKDFASKYMNNDKDIISNCNSLINWQVTKAGTSGFISGLGGWFTLPVAIPANVASVWFIQLRMIAAIAVMGGHDIKDDKIKSLSYACLLGNGIKDIIKDLGIVVGNKLSINLVKSISGKTITAINQKVGFRLLTKFGEKGVVNLGKVIPVVGGVIGATIDSLSTQKVGKIAMHVFISNNIENKIGVNKAELNKLFCYINLIKIDNKVEDSELDFIKNYIDSLISDENEKDELIKKLYTPGLIKVDFNIIKQQKAEVFNLMNNLVSIAKSDNKISKVERMYIYEVAEELGVSSRDVNELFNE